MFEAQSRIGPYVLLGQLGGGGMGDVYLGRSRGGRLVAVKVVRPHLARDPEFRRRFAAEAEAARKVGGFYTAHVVDADTAAAVPWLATAYVPGPSLEEAVDAYGPLPDGAVAALGAGLAEGLAAIHACGLVHRDLKPGNVILAEDGPRIIDFGIARALDAEVRLTAHGVIGTPAFMSPEQAQGGEAGAASDVFALAGLLVHAVTGRRPFGSGTTYEVLQRVVHEAPDLTSVPASLAELLLPCLDKEPARRPTAVELLDRFAALAESYDAEERRNPDQITTMIVQRGALAATLVLPGESEGERGREWESGSADGHARRALQSEVAAVVGALYARRAGADRTVPVVLPPLPGTFARTRRVTVIRWYKRPGEEVRAGEGLFSVSDGRARAVIASPAEGVLREVGPGTGEGVSVGALMGVVERRAAPAAPKAKVKGTAPEKARVEQKPKPKPVSKPAPKPTPKPKPKPTPRPAPKPAPKPTPKPQPKKSNSDLGGWLGGLGVVGLILYLTLYSQDIFDAKAGDCVRIEDSGQGSAYVEPCDLPVPWDDTYQVLDDPECYAGTVRSWSDNEENKAITLCLKKIDPWADGDSGAQ